MKLFKSKHIMGAFLITMVFTNTACNKKLEVLPINMITPDQIQDDEDIFAILSGCYNSFQNFDSYGERFFIVADLLANAGQVYWVGNYPSYRDIEDKKQISDNDLAAGMWLNSYSIIYSANTVLKYIDLANNNNKTAYEAEARFIRALAYFNLVNFYSLPYSDGNAASNEAVPLILNAYEDYQETRDKVSRTTVEKVYNQIIDDLTFAAETEDFAIAKGRGNRYAAYAYLAKVYLNQGKYAEAANAANKAASTNFVLSKSFESEFNNSDPTPEDLFGILQSSQSNSGTANNGIHTLLAPHPEGRGDIRIDTSLLNIYENGDDRKDFIIWGAGIAVLTQGLYTKKYLELYRVIPIIRLADVLLMRAEANLRNNSTIGADPLDDINAVRGRAHASLLDDVTADDVVAERLRELAFEGDRLWTLKRLKMDVGDYPYNDPMLVLPVPQRERDANGNLSQNEGYND
ncbi:hypothetical protein COR50_06005 [Chitinophaga caeni]|uniref:RagB/SusD family nutrient uptake outer membrane protein n=1 Tax=Chitinophaga caeni TaxID=2029983 RepID=A0A291QS94_9BACT|nr:RagB/SusD family nutrient uptake outer membrane protein [Chitinophaga caeni]ATL46763.1 hypothetical protein COR50_06005 [Chitinophaga caeni]